MSCDGRKQVFGNFEKIARGLKFRIYVVEVLHYLCSENKGADQLCGYREADLLLCFCKWEKLVYS